MSQGIQALKSEIDLATTLVGIVVQARKDGKIDAADLGLLLQLIPVLGPAAQGMGGVVPELKDLTTEEAAELAAYVTGKLPGMSSKATVIVEKSLKFALAAYELEQAITAPAAA